MSMMPDTTEEATIHLPGNNQMPLRKAIVDLHKKRPDLFVRQPRYASSLWDVEVLLTTTGGDYLAGLIQASLEDKVVD